MCPSQWEGIDENGHSIYIRYRWGTLLVYRSKQPSTDISAALDGDLVLDLKLGHDYDGYLDYETLKEVCEEHDIILPDTEEVIRT